MFEKARQTLKKMDLFGQNINLNLDGEDQYTTSLGGFFSILIITIVLIFFQSNIFDFFNQTNITADVQSNFSEDPDQIVLNDNDFMFALSIEQSNFNTLPYFNISISARTYESLANGTKIKTTTPVNLIPCTLDRFQNIFQKFGQNFTQSFKQQDLATWLCPDYGYQIPVGGRYASKIFDFVKIDVTQCSNNTANNQILTWKPTCASQETLDTHLKSNTQFRVRLYITNTIINPSKQEDVSQIFLDDELFFAFVPHKLLRQSDIYLKKYNLQTDNSLVPVFKDDIQSKFIQKSDFRDMVLLGSELDKLYTSLYIRRSPFTTQATRQFQKLDELLSYLGGFVNIVVVFLGILVAFYNKQQYLIELANKLYDFNAKNEEQQKQQFKRNSDLVKKITIIKRQSQLHSPTMMQAMISGQAKTTPNEAKGNNRQQNPSISLNYGNKSPLLDPNSEFQKQQEEIIAKLGIKSRKEFLTNQLQTLLNRGKPIFLSFRYIISQLTMGTYFRNNDCILMEKAIKKINQDLDIYVIIEKLKQINLIKDVILNKDQQIIFNFAPKELISISDTKNLPSRIDLLWNQTSEKQIKTFTDITQLAMKNKQKKWSHPMFRGYYKVFKAYDRLFQKEQDTHGRINAVLSNKLGKEIKDIFKVSQFIDFNLFQHKISDRIKYILHRKLKRIRQKLSRQQEEQHSENFDLFSVERDINLDEQNILREIQVKSHR